MRVDLRAAPASSTRRTSAREIFGWRASTSSWPRITVSGVRSSCEASETNAALAREGVVEAVEHVVEGVGQHERSRRAAARVDARGEIAPRARRRRSAPSGAAAGRSATRQAKPSSSAASSVDVPANRKVRATPSARA